MNGTRITLKAQTFLALPSGALYWPAQAMLILSDMHLGKSERIARLGGALLPPYETRDTLMRLDADLQTAAPDCVLCLGDSFDDTQAAAALGEAEMLWLTRLMAGRRWIWIEGNHDPGPLALGGTHLAQLAVGAITLRHIADAGADGEISGHFHPKASLSARGQRITRPCFLTDRKRVILPAYGSYTGGLSCRDPALAALMGPDARAVLLGTPPQAIPMPAD